jgi:dihydroorotate dehydrogenase (NAD+) catalytic subunit
MNTLLGMQIDVRRKKPTLANVFGGLSGPAIKPVAVRMVYQVRKAIPLPIVGMGGIRTGEDVAEFLLAGANAVSVGTAALVEPSAPLRILKEFEAYMEQQGFGTVRELKEAFQDIER